MHKSIIIDTKHTASLCILYSDSVQKDRNKEVIADAAIQEALVDILSAPDLFDTVYLDPDFRCNALTEIGLASQNIENLKKASTRIIEWVEQSEFFVAVDY